MPVSLPSGSPSKKKKKAPGPPKKLKQEKITDHVTVVKKKRDRFKGMSEEEVSARLLPDHLAPDLDIVIVSMSEEEDLVSARLLPDHLAPDLYIVTHRKYMYE